MFGMTREYLEGIRKLYPAGTRVECISMSDPFAITCGVRGTVQFVDDAGQIHVRWDNGRGLALIPGEDSFRIIEEETT